MIILALICGVIYTSCESDKAETQGEKVSGELYVMGTRSADVSSLDELDLLFTGDDIKTFKTGESFEVANGGVYYGELIFNDLKVEQLSIGLYTTIYIFIGETLVFDPPIKIYSPVSSMSSNDLQMSIYDGKIRLMEFYQSWEWMSDPAAINEKLKAQEENSKMRKQQLDVFFKYLSDAGKIEYTENHAFPPVIDEPTPPAVIDSTKIR